jgi:hypothetical protein
MSRRYTNLSTAIWREGNFCALSAEEQHVLFLIESQPDITAAGTLPLTLRRWAALFRGGTAEGVRSALDGLERAGRVVVDDDTEELLVVSFVADDRSYGNIKRSPVILRAAGEVVSLRIRQALAVEFRRVGLPTDVLALPPGPGGPSPSRNGDSPSDSHADSLSTSEPETGETDDGDDPCESVETGPPDEKSQVNRLSNSQADTHTQFDGTVGCRAEEVSASVHSPHLSVLSPAPSAPSGSAAFVANALGTDDDETREVIDQIRRIHKPRNLSGYIRTMANNGDLEPVLADVRQDRARRAAIAERRTQRATPEPAAEPPEPSATPEQAAADRAALRQLLAGLKPGRGEREPTPLSDLLGKAASA